MLIRENNEIKICTEPVKKNKGKKMIAVGIYIIIVFIPICVIIGAMFGADFWVKEIYILLGLLCFNCFLCILLGLISIKREKRGNKTIAKINDRDVTLYTQKEIKQIDVNEITKITIDTGNYHPKLTIFYNDYFQEQQYTFTIDIVNKNLFVTAIKEYNNHIIVEEK